MFGKRRETCTLDWAVRISNVSRYQAIASECRHDKGNFLVELAIWKIAPSGKYPEGDYRTFCFKCPSEERVPMELIPLADHGKYAVKGKIRVIGFADGDVSACATEEEQVQWLDNMGLHLYGYPVKYENGH